MTKTSLPRLIGGVSVPIFRFLCYVVFFVLCVCPVSCVPSVSGLSILDGLFW